MPTLVTAAGDVELPKMTKALHALQAGADVDDVDAKASACYEFLAKVIPADALAECVDGKTFEDCDMTKVLDLYDEVDEAYWGAYRERQMGMISKSVEQVGALGTLIDTMTKVQGLSAKADRRVFRVK